MSAPSEINEFSSCRHETLAQGRGCIVTQCTCGHLHLRIGVLTLKLTPKQLEDLATTLGQAAARVDGIGEERPQLLC